MFIEKDYNYSNSTPSRKINISGMIIWGLIGFLAGVFINFFLFLITFLEEEGYNREFFIYFLSGGKEGNMWDLEFWGLVIVLTLVLGFKGATSKNKAASKNSETVEFISKEGLSLIERIIAWAVCIMLTPIIAGPIIYYGWRNKYPQKARQANDISIVVFLVELMIVIIAIFAGR